MNYCLLIDMNGYAGDFEREMCAYLTGQVNPNSVLLDEAEMFLKKYPLNEKVSVNERNRVVELSYSSNKWDNGSGFVYKPGNEEAALEKYKAYMQEYKEKAMKVLNRDRVFLGEEAYQEEVISLNLQYEDAMKLEEPIRSRVKHSIAIYFKEPVTEEEFNFLHDRANLFCDYYEEGIQVEGLYFLEAEENNVIFDIS